MVLEYFENIEDGGSDLPFLNKHEGLEFMEDGDQFLVREVWRTNKGGLLVKTVEFLLYYDQRSQVAVLLREALNEYLNKRGEGFAIYAVIAKKSKNRALLAADFDKPLRWAGEEGKWAIADALEPSASSVQTNPFISPAPKSRKSHKVT